MVWMRPGRPRTWSPWRWLMKGLDHPALGSLAAVEEDHLPLPPYYDGGGAPALGGHAPAGSEEDDLHVSPPRCTNLEWES